MAKTNDTDKPILTGSDLWKEYNRQFAESGGDCLVKPDGSPGKLPATPEDRREAIQEIRRLSDLWGNTASLREVQAARAQNRLASTRGDLSQMHDTSSDWGGLIRTVQWTSNNWELWRCIAPELRKWEEARRAERAEKVTQALDQTDDDRC